MDVESTPQSTDAPKKDPATEVVEATETAASTEAAVEVTETSDTTPEAQTAMVAEATAEPEDDFYNKIEPKGAYTFVLLVGLFMTGYWFLTYFEVFVLRGG